MGDQCPREGKGRGDERETKSKGAGFVDVRQVVDRDVEETHKPKQTRIAVLNGICFHQLC